MNKIKSVLFMAGISLALAFSCSSDDSGGSDIKNYRTVKIGEQVWMAENLNYNVEGSKCYDNEESNCSKYGRLYTWATAMGIDAKYNEEEWGGSDVKHQGICPSGWHLPSNTEWGELISYVESNIGCSNCAGRYLKTSNWNGNNKYGFSALPGGNGSSGGSFSSVGDVGRWWSSSEDISYYAYGRGMGYSLAGAGYSSRVKSYLYSVRCLQD